MSVGVSAEKTPDEATARTETMHALQKIGVFITINFGLERHLLHQEIGRPVPNNIV